VRKRSWIMGGLLVLAAAAVQLLSSHAVAVRSAEPARTYHVGPTRTYKRIAEVVDRVRPGDTVLIDSGTYREAVKWRGGDAKGLPITVKGIGRSRPVIDGTGVDVSAQGAAPRALFQVEGDNYIFENLAFQNARNGNNGAGLRVVRARQTVLRHLKITRCDMGMMSGENDELLIEYCEFAFNGTPDFNGYSHNFYLGGDRSTIRFCYIHDSTNGQNFKSRGHYTELLYNYIVDAHDGVEGGETTKEIGFPDAKDSRAPNSNAVLIGNLIIKKGSSPQFIDFGPETGGERDGTLYMINNTVVAASPSTCFIRLSSPRVKAVLYNNIFYGSRLLLTGAGASNVSGANNWLPSGATLPPTLADTIQGTDPGFADLITRDFRLRRGSPCIDRGINVMRYVDGKGEVVVVKPTREYVKHLKDVPRPDDGRLDLGAYEFRSSPGRATQ